MKNKENNLSRKVTFRMTEAEFLKLQKLAEAGQLSLSDTCRTMITKTEIREKSLTETQRKELFAQLGHIGGNLNQIARRLNEGGTESEKETLESVLKAYRWLWSEVQQWHM